MSIQVMLIQKPNRRSRAENIPILQIPVFIYIIGRLSRIFIILQDSVESDNHKVSKIATYHFS